MNRTEVGSQAAERTTKELDFCRWGAEGAESHPQPTASPPPCAATPASSTGIQGQDEGKAGETPNLHHSKRFLLLSR